MKRVEMHKLKKAVISLQKLDLLPVIPILDGGKKENKGSSRTSESEDRSSENVSTGSTDSNTICTDDDDLEKKIQAFSIPVKKENEKSKTKNGNETIKNNSDKGAVIDKGSESIKSGKKVTFSLLKSDAKSKAGSKLDISKSSQPEGASISADTDNISRGTRKKKENLKDKSNFDGEEKSISLGKKHSGVKQKPIDINNLNPSNSNSSYNKTPLERNLRNGKDDQNNEKVAERKTRKDQHGSNTDNMVGLEVSRKRKAQKENEQVPPKKLLPEKRSSKLCSEPSAPVKDTNKRNIEKKLRSNATKTTVLLKKGSLKVNDKSHLNVKRSTRISNAVNILQRDERKRKELKNSENKTQKKSIEFKKSSENQAKPKVVVKKGPSDNKDKNTDFTKLKTDDKKVDKKIKEKVSEKRGSSTMGKKSTHNTLIPKEEYAKGLLKVTVLGKDSKQASVSPEKIKKSISKVQNLHKNRSDIFDDGEELLEKICDILEDASGMSDSKGVEKKNLSKQQSVSNRIVSPSKDRVLIPDPSLFRPKIFHKNSRFPSHGKGTVSYKKLWKWSHYVKMPSDMWSLHKHPDGNFVIIFHISETSPFPKLIIDKCIIFKETASPCVKIYGKDVLALSSEKELQTLGNMCTFLKHLHDISLCEGMLSSLAGESNSNCELYTDEKVSSPYKCKSCL